MDFFELIDVRESIRDYDPEAKVSKSTLLKIVDAGRVAPSASNKQPWKFLIISSDDMLNRIRPCYHKEWFKNAPHILIVVGDNSSSWVRKTDDYNFIETDLTIAMDHMILAAEALGVGTCWISAFDNAILREALQLSAKEVVYSLTPLGYPNKGFTKKSAKIRKSIDEVVEFL